MQLQPKSALFRRIETGSAQIRLLVFLIGLTSLVLHHARADLVTFAWDPPDPADHVAGYSLTLWDINGKVSSFDVGDTNRFTMFFQGDRSFLISVAAYDSAHVESDPSIFVPYPAADTCLISLPVQSANHPADWASSGTVVVNSDPNCSWTPETDAPWITLGDLSASGGAKVVRYFVERNKRTTSRESVIKIGEAQFHVSQAAATPSLPIVLMHLPDDFIVDEGTALTLSVKAVDEELEYQWFKGGIPINGATNSVYSLADADASVAGDYSVEIKNAFGSIEDGPVHVRVYLAPHIEEDIPSGLLEFAEGSPVHLLVIASGSDLHYSWSRGNQRFEVDAPVLPIPSLNEDQVGYYRVFVYNRIGFEFGTPAYVTTFTHEQRTGRIHVEYAGGYFAVHGEGVPGESYDLEASDDLLTWRKIDSVVVDEGGFFAIDAPNPSQDDNPHCWFVRTVRRPSGQ